MHEDYKNLTIEWTKVWIKYNFLEVSLIEKIWLTKIEVEGPERIFGKREVEDVVEGRKGQGWLTGPDPSYLGHLKPNLELAHAIEKTHQTRLTQWPQFILRVNQTQVGSPQNSQGPGQETMHSKPLLLPTGLQFFSLM